MCVCVRERARKRETVGIYSAVPTVSTWCNSLLRMKRMPRHPVAVDANLGFAFGTPAGGFLNSAFKAASSASMSSSSAASAAAVVVALLSPPREGEALSQSPVSSTSTAGPASEPPDLVPALVSRPSASRVSDRTDSGGGGGGGANFERPNNKTTKKGKGGGEVHTCEDGARKW